MVASKPRYRRTADGRTIALDGLTNVVANLGTSRDKASFSKITAANLDPITLLTTYRGSWAARKGVNIPALDACRKWREWQAQDVEVEAIENEEGRLNVQGKVLRAKIAARLFGGCALLIGADVANPALPLTADRIGKGGLKYLTLVQMRMLSPGHIEENPESPQFGQPAYWQLSAGGSLSAKIHPSRLVIFHGAHLPDDALAPVQQGWGDSVLTAAIDTVLSFDSVAANIASLVFEAKVDTIGIPQFMQRLGDVGYETQILKRFALAEAGKGINGTLIHDAEEILGQKQASFASLPDILDRFAVNVCASFDIPITRFMGQSPAGLTSTGESDIRNYYDAISSQQELEMGPAMAVLDECLIRSALGSRPPEVHYRWASLWQVSDSERATNGKTHADTIAALKGTGLFPDEPLAEAAVNLMTESGCMPGLEGYMADYFAANPDPNAVTEDPVVPEVPDVTAQEESSTANDAAPMTLYVRRDVLNAADIIAWAKGQGFKTTLPASDMHVTVTYSRQAVDWFKMGEAWQSEMKIAAGGARMVEKFGEERVLLFASSELSWRHNAMVEAGASWDHPEYQPHITISYDPESPDIASVTAYPGEIILGPEIFQEVKEDWQAGVTEE